MVAVPAVKAALSARRGDGLAGGGIGEEVFYFLEKFLCGVKKLSFDSFAEQSEVFLCPFGKHESAASWNFDRARGLAIAAHFTQEPQVDVKAANGFCVIVAPDGFALDTDVGMDGFEAIPIRSPDSDRDTIFSEHGHHIGALGFVVADEADRPTELFAIFGSERNRAVYGGIKRIRHEYDAGASEGLKVPDSIGFGGKVNVVKRKMAEEIAGLIRPGTHVIRGIAHNGRARRNLFDVFESRSSNGKGFIEPEEIERSQAHGVKDLTVDVAKIGWPDAEEFPSRPLPEPAIGAKHIGGEQFDTFEMMTQFAQGIKTLEACAASVELADV